MYLIEVVEEGDSLHDHGVDFVGAELELVSGQAVSQTERHGVDVLVRGGAAYVENLRNK